MSDIVTLIDQALARYSQYDISSSVRDLLIESAANGSAKTVLDNLSAPSA